MGDNFGAGHVFCTYVAATSVLSAVVYPCTVACAKEGLYGVCCAPGRGWSSSLVSWWEQEGCAVKINRRRQFSSLHSPALPTPPSAPLGGVQVVALAWEKGLGFETG